MKIVQSTLRQNRDVLLYLLANYADKALIFLLPLVVLYVGNNKQAYNDIEYIFSIANIMLPFFCFISSYAFYGYKESNASTRFIEEYKSYCSFTTLILLVSSIITVCAISLLNPKAEVTLFVYIAVRFLYQNYIQYFSNYYRLINRPIVIVLQSLASSLISLVLIVLVCLIGKPLYLLCLFLPQAALMLYPLYPCTLELNISGYKDFVVKSIRYTFPILINCTIVAFIMNYGKIYAYNFLSDNDMYSFSYTMRISMVMTMANSSLIAFWGKDVFINGYQKSIVLKYGILIGLSFIGSFIILYVLNLLRLTEQVDINVSTLFLMLYTLLYCIGAFMEMHFGRLNKNRYVLYSSVLACIVFMFLLFFVGIKNLETLALYMFIYGLSYFSILSFFALRINEKK